MPRAASLIVSKTILRKSKQANDSTHFSKKNTCLSRLKQKYDTFSFARKKALD